MRLRFLARFTLDALTQDRLAGALRPTPAWRFRSARSRFSARSAFCALLCAVCARCACDFSRGLRSMHLRSFARFALRLLALDRAFLFPAEYFLYYTIKFISRQPLDKFLTMYFSLFRQRDLCRLTKGSTKRAFAQSSVRFFGAHHTKPPSGREASRSTPPVGRSCRSVKRVFAQSSAPHFGTHYVMPSPLG